MTLTNSKIRGPRPRGRVCAIISTIDLFKIHIMSDTMMAVITIGSRKWNVGVAVRWWLNLALVLLVFTGHDTCLHSKYTTCIGVRGELVDEIEPANETTYGCSFLHTQPRYYQVTSVLTLQNVPENDELLNDALIRTLRRQLLLSECQVILSEGVACTSGTTNLPCSDPVHRCSLGSPVEPVNWLTNDVYRAIVEETCDVNGDGVVDSLDDVNTLVCQQVVEYSPEAQRLVKSGACEPTCDVGQNSTIDYTLDSDLDACLRFDLTLNLPTEQAAKVFERELESDRVKEDIEVGLSGFGNEPLLFSVVRSNIGVAVGFGFFPPPPPPPPPVKQLGPLPDLGKKSDGRQLVYGDWSPCYPSCGSGISTRTVQCIDGEGIVLSSEQCYEVLLAETAKTCTTECARPYWQYSPWQTCSKRCGTGESTRTATCISDGDVSCSEDSKEPLTRECNTVPCNVFSWVETQWEECSASCGGGTQTRNVTCVDSQGQPSTENTCLYDTKPPSTRSCNMQPCDFCEASICLGRGVCSNGVCECSNDYSGQHCEAHKSCDSGVVDNFLECCPSGITSSLGECCPEGSTIDATGSCCSGKIDACGVCNGDNNFIDIQGKCCKVIDADGVCCSSELLDECGVCNGIGNTCNILLGLQMKVPADIIEDDAVQEESIHDYIVQLGNMTGIEPNRMTIGGISKAPLAGRRLLSSPRALLQEDDSVTLLVQVEIAPKESGDLLVPFSSAYYAEALPEASSRYGSAAFDIESVPISTRSGVCGNGICEIGERATIGMDPGTCSQDCGLPSKLCPGGCQNGGQCQPSSGICVCLPQYSGESCEECADGYMVGEDGKLCTFNAVEAGMVAPAVLSENGEALVSGQDSGGTSAGVIVGAIFGTIGGIALILATFILIRRRRMRPSLRKQDVYVNKIYQWSDSEESGLRKKYGMSPHSFGYGDSDPSDTIRTEAYNQQQYVGMYGNEDQGQVQQRPFSAQVSYVQGTTVLSSSEQNSGFQENLYVKKHTPDTQHEVKETPVEQDDVGEYIRAGVSQEPDIDITADPVLNACEDHSGAHSLGSESPSTSYEYTNENMRHEDSKMIFNPVYRAERISDDQQTIVVEDEDDLNVRRKKLEALRAAVRSLESRAPSEASFRSISENIVDMECLEEKKDFMVGRPPVPALSFSQLHNKPSKKEVSEVDKAMKDQYVERPKPKQSFFTVVKNALTPPRFRSQQYGNAGDGNHPEMSHSQSSFNRVIEAVDGALNRTNLN